MNTTYQEAIENSNIVSKTDINGIITFVNDEFCYLFGFTKDELIGKNHNIVRHPDTPKENFETLWSTILNKKVYKATVKNLTKDKKEIYLNTTIIPILDEFENIIEFIAIRYDITNEVILQEELKEKQKLLFWQSRMASLGQMIGNIAHQWRQPLTELNLTLFNMKKASLKKDEKKIEELYKESKNLISSMSTTIEDFMNFFDPKKEKKSFEIKDSINEALTILKKLIQQENIKIKVDVPTNYKVLGVSNELSQVIINLIQNAKDAFITNDIEDKNILITLKEDLNKKYFLLEIEDNAGGIKEENQDSIFEPYFTTKHKSQGTGLGLFMSKMIVEKSLEGTLRHTNSENGSIFTITISNEKE